MLPQAARVLRLLDASGHCTAALALLRSRMVKVPVLAAPQLGSCASSGRAWRLSAARHSQEEAEPLGSKPLPRKLELAASKPAHSPPLTFQARPPDDLTPRAGGRAGADRGAGMRGVSGVTSRTVLRVDGCVLDKAVRCYISLRKERKSMNISKFVDFWELHF